MTQLPLPIAWSRRGGPESLLIHDANAEAIALIRSWPRWPSPATLLVGPARSGRSLIAQMFTAETGGTVIDDAQSVDEQRLFHLWNEARDSGHPLLLVAEAAPPEWQVKLPDLRTRLATAGVARILSPDHAILVALIVHGLETAGSAFAPDLPEFLARRVPRTYEAVDALLIALNEMSLATGQKISIAAARQMLCNKFDI